ncbi:hypothetical protein [Acinetobacter oleivorans]|uniref:hypothetical protein n=1 Tax=Acinetobacter oleivorans TaxID=1148157 RepID=UPI003F7BBC3F
MNEKLDSLKENIVVILGVLAAVFGLFLMFFYGENLRIVIYAIGFHFTIYLFILRKYISSHRILFHIISIFTCYVLLQIVWGASPKLQLKEFEWTHPHWQPTYQVQLVDSKSDVYRRSRSVSYAYVSVIYQYEYQGQHYSAEHSDLVRQYSMLLTDEPRELRQLSESKLKHQFLNGQAVVLVNPAKPQESIFFYSQQWLDIRGSWLAKILWGIQLVSIFILLAILGLIIKKVINPKNKIQVWSKPKRYLFIAIFFIGGWTVLFVSWILFMYVKNAP